jgi:dienelactone hydrolase
MRFYLNASLVVGFSLMATTACLGMLQFVAARGGYVGLSLFTGDRIRGQSIGATITVAALLLYVSFAPEIRTPGPAGTEVAEMFAGCAVVALALTLFGADLRLRKRTARKISGGKSIRLGPLSAKVYYPSQMGENTGAAELPDQLPAILVLPDPSAFVTAPPSLLEALGQAEIATVVLDSKRSVANDRHAAAATLLGLLSQALAGLAELPRIDRERLGLLGLGLGGDAVLCAGASRHDIRAILAVSPVRLVTDEPKKHDAQLSWLHELGLLEARRWRELWPALQAAAAALSLRSLEPTALSAQVKVVYAADSFVTTRSTAALAGGLPVSNTGHFTLLGDAHARELVVAWLRDALTTGAS